MAFLSRKKRGFTLIELLVVIAIIGILSSVVLVSLNSARLKAADAKRMSDFHNIKIALELYYDKYGRYPASPNNYPYNHPADYTAVATALVSGGFLPSIPRDPAEPQQYYMAWDYGASNGAGLIIVTSLGGITPTTVGPNSSCRPFTQNWCATDIASTYYCLCNTY